MRPALRRTEATILGEIREALNTARDATGALRCRLYRNSVGYDEQRRVHYGQVGSPDLLGVLRCGRAFGIEVKGERGRMRPEQVAWWKAAALWGVAGGEAHSVAEAMELLAEAERTCPCGRHRAGGGDQ